MHGRVKVRTTEEEKARKDKERQEKLKVFKHVMQKIQLKRKQGESDPELLELTGKVLSTNPDIYTLWNIRREILINLRKSEVHDEEMPKYYDSELQLTEYCLKINPKSYCAWHHREWILKTRPDPDWQKELDLCNRYLKLDERNFHTWDYRRFVVGRCKPPLEEEFNFTTEKLYDNFSNYSAWHYRSKMLVALHPDLEGGRPIKDNHHKHELKMVESAAFTDPDDTSAWFYQRWLLGAVKSTTQLVVCTITPEKISAAFNKYVSEEFIKSKTKIIINDMLLQGNWISCTGLEHDNLWIYKHDAKIRDGMDIKVEFIMDQEVIRIIPFIEHDSACYVAINDIKFKMEYTQPVIDELKSQLGSCRQLIILEPDNRWTLLTATFLLYCIDANVHHKEIITNLHNLQTMDKLRAGYYQDLITKWSIEHQLLNDYQNKELKLEIKFPEKLTSLPHLQYYSYCRVVDLSYQNLTSNVLPSLIKLQHCKNLSLKSNKLTTLSGFPALELVELILSDNEALHKEEVEIFQITSDYIIIY